jgi:hypothetical protein
MIIRVLIITFVAAITAFLSPRWVGYAAIGLILGLVIGLTVKLFRRSRRFRWGFAIVIALCGVVAILVLPVLRITEFYTMVEPLTIAVNYTASISPLKNALQWQVQEEFLISETELPKAWRNRYPSLDEATNNEISAVFPKTILQKLRLEEWKTSGFVGTATQFRRTREFAATVNWFSATTAFAIPIEIQTHNSLIHLVPDQKSTITIISPKYVIASTFPAYSSRVDILSDDQERLTIPLEFSRLEQPELRIAILSPLLRWPLGPKIGSFSLWSTVQWFFLAVCAIFSGQIKEKLLKPIIAPIFPSKKQYDKKRRRT